MTATASTRELPPIVTAALLHAGCWAVLAAVAYASPLVLPWAWVEGAGAAALGFLAGLPYWWLPINLVFSSALLAALDAQIPSGWLLAGFLLLFSFQTAAWRQRVPFFTSGARTARRVARLLPRRRSARVLDLGCGTGSFLKALATARPDAVCHGVELAPLPYCIGRLRAWRCGGAIAVRWGDFWTVDLASYDLVYTFLSPHPMARLWAKARREMRPGTLFVSNGFAVPGVPPSAAIATGERLNPVLYVWRM